MAVSSTNTATEMTRRRIQEILKSYFYWTYPRGSFHYDVLVTLILVFIFATPWLWDYGAKPLPAAGPVHPMAVVVNGRGVIVTVEAADIDVPAAASYGEVKRILRKAIEPVMGDAVFVEQWKTIPDGKGGVAWEIWAHR